jgi:phosphomannomutase
MTAALPDASLFRAYDLRGVMGENLQLVDGYAIAQSFASHVIESAGNSTPRIVLMRDGRLSSPALAAQFRDGLASTGATVLDAGIGPTPMCYFAGHHLSAEATVMVTGSHNPKDHNGAKFTCAGKSLHGEALMELHRRLARGSTTTGRGHSEEISVLPAYLAAIKKALPPGLRLGDLNIAWDAGNGAAGEVIEALVAGGTRAATTLYTALDGNFPHHHPDPCDEENLKDLKKIVRQRGAMLGLAFDGDGDRLGVVDERGQRVSPDHLLMLFARDILSRHSDATIMADVKTSDQFFTDVKLHGGHPLMWKTGHALIKDKMRETGALFAGEASGHIFFADEYFGFDDALYAALRLIRIVVASGQKLSALVASLPPLYSSLEWRIPCAESEKEGIMTGLAARLLQEGARVNRLDGVRVSNDHGWWLIRPSNTQALLTLRCEGFSAAGLSENRRQLAQYLHAYGLRLP